MQPGRNDPCPCGSGKKYKKCCGAIPASVVTEIPALRARAKAAFESGDLNHAISHGLQVLRAAPADFEAHHVLGLSYLRLGRIEEAAEHLEQAARLDPRNPFVLSNLALAYQRLGRLDDAERRAREALALDPTLADAHNNLAQALSARGQDDAAVASYRRAIALAPGNALFHFNLGVALQPLQADIREVEACYRQALALDPRFAPAMSNLGLLCLREQRLDEAFGLLTRAQAASPDDPQIMTSLGLVLQKRKQYEEAMGWFRRAIEIADYLPAYSSLAVVLENTGEIDAAIDMYRRILARDADYPRIMVNLFRAFIQYARYEEGYRFFISTSVKRQLSPSEWSAVLGLLQQACDHARIPDVWPILQRALDAGALAQDDLKSLLLPLNYDDSLPETEIMRCHAAWGELAARAAGFVDAPRLAPAIGGRLRVGYLSPDFGNHPVGFFIRNIIAHHDRAGFEVFCYSNRNIRDAVTEEIARSSDHFITVWDLEDAELAQRIRADGIQVLVDLTGHTAHMRLYALTRRPAPVQIMYLGYPNTSGAGFIDYWITDPYAHAENDSLHTERLLRLPECFLCFGGFEEQAPGATPPAARTGHVTFGSFNNLAKLSPTTLRLWAGVLQAVPGARLLLKTKGLESEAARANVVAAFRAHGVGRDRLELRGPVVDRHAHLVQYRDDVDIALDPAPYNGSTTTCEALWMGVPVVTLVGPAHRQRVSYSILKNIGIEDTIAHTGEQYVAIAAGLARDLGALARLRTRVAAAVRASILCDPPRFTRQFEDVLRSALDNRQAEAVPGP